MERWAEGDGQNESMAGRLRSYAAVLREHAGHEDSQFGNARGRRNRLIDICLGMQGTANEKKAEEDLVKGGAKGKGGGKGGGPLALAQQMGAGPMAGGGGLFGMVPSAGDGPMVARSGGAFLAMGGAGGPPTDFIPPSFEKKSRGGSRAAAAPPSGGFFGSAAPPPGAAAFLVEDADELELALDNAEEQLTALPQTWAPPEPVKEYVEAQYYIESGNTSSNKLKEAWRAEGRFGGRLSGAASFWADVAEHVLEKTSGEPFVTGSFLHATTSLSEVICMLALVDFSNEDRPAASAEESESKIVDGEFLAGRPTVLFCRETVAAAEPTFGDDDAPGSEERFLLLAKAFRADTESPEHATPIAPRATPFLTGVPYRLQVSVASAHAKKQEIDLLIQIPAGSLPLSGELGVPLSRRTQALTLTQYNFVTLTLDFYFPRKGAFKGPALVSVSREGALLQCSGEGGADNGFIRVRDRQEYETSVEVFTNAVTFVGLLGLMMKQEVEFVEKKLLDFLRNRNLLDGEMGFQVEDLVAFFVLSEKTVLQLIEQLRAVDAQELRPPQFRTGAADVTSDEKQLEVLAERANQDRKTILEKIEKAWYRRDLYKQCVDVLRKRGLFFEGFWALGMTIYNDGLTATEFLAQHQSTLQKLGKGFVTAGGRGTTSSGNCGILGQTLASTHSMLIPVDDWLHKDYFPLFNKRFHKMEAGGGGGGREGDQSILNRELRKTWETVISQILRSGCEQDVQERLRLCYYLLCQDRVEEARAIFEEVDKAAGNGLRASKHQVC